MGYRLGSLLFVILFFGVFLIASIFNYQNRFKIRYSTRNMFPFELNYNMHFIDNFFGNLAFILSIFGSIFFFVFYDTSYKNGFLIAISIIGILCSLIIGFVFFTPIKYFRFHLVLVALLFPLSFVLPGSICIASYRMYQITSEPVCIVSFIASIVLMIVVFALIMNPRLSASFRGQVVVKEDGSQETIRPKYVVLAFSEWILIFTFLIDLVVAFIFSFAF